MRVPFRVVFEQRGETPRRLSLLVPLASVFAALFFGALFLIATGHSPIDTYSNMFQDGFASFNGITDTLALSTVLICTGISAAFAFQMNLYNIGGEGQLYLGLIGGAPGRTHAAGEVAAQEPHEDAEDDQNRKEE